MNNESRVRVGRVHDERTPEDGARVLVDRLWPRGLSKDRSDLDEWCKQISPSSALRKWYGHDPDRFAEFTCATGQNSAIPFGPKRCSTCASWRGTRR